MPNSNRSFVRLTDMVEPQFRWQTIGRLVLQATFVVLVPGGIAMLAGWKIWKSRRKETGLVKVEVKKEKNE